MNVIEHLLALVRQVARVRRPGAHLLLLGGWLSLAPPFIHAFGKA